MKAITQDGVIKILILTAVLVLALIVFYPFSPAARQNRRLVMAKEHASLFTPKLKTNPRFALVQFGAYTGEGGMFWVVGNVASEGDLADLRKLVEESKPPIAIKWDVKVFKSE